MRSTGGPAFGPGPGPGRRPRPRQTGVNQPDGAEFSAHGADTFCFWPGRQFVFFRFFGIDRVPDLFLPVPVFSGDGHATVRSGSPLEAAGDVRGMSRDF